MCGTGSFMDARHTRWSWLYDPRKDVPYTCFEHHDRTAAPTVAWLHHCHAAENAVVVAACHGAKLAYLSRSQINIRPPRSAAAAAAATEAQPKRCICVSTNGQGAPCCKHVLKRTCLLAWTQHREPTATDPRAQGVPAFPQPVTVPRCHFNKPAAVHARAEAVQLSWLPPAWHGPPRHTHPCATHNPEPCTLNPEPQSLTACACSPCTSAQPSSVPWPHAPDSLTSRADLGPTWKPAGCCLRRLQASLPPAGPGAAAQTPAAPLKLWAQSAIRDPRLRVSEVLRGLRGVGGWRF